MKVLTIAMLGVLGACAVQSVTPSDGPVPIAYGSADGFTPLVPSNRAGPTCSEPSNAATSSAPPEARVVSMDYAGTPERRVTVIVDATGTPIRYLDVRGDVADAEGGASDRTTIGLYLAEGYAVLSNRVNGAAPTMLEVPVSDAITSSALDNPGRVIEHVLSMCSGEG